MLVKLQLVVLVTQITLLNSLVKAGRSRWFGRRPRNRGVVMNPVDHPMGGGEGRQVVVTHVHARACMLRVLRPCTKKLSNKYIIERKKKKNKSRVNYESFIKKVHTSTYL